MQITAKPGLFYGWWIVAVSLVVLFITLGLGYYSFGVFIKPLIAEFGWSRATVSGAMSIFLVAWGLACPLVGWLTDRYGPRRVIISGAIALGAGFCLLSLTSALWQFYLFYACAGAASATCSELPVSSAVSNWFTRKRGIAMGITTAGIGLGGLFLVPSVSYLILRFGWQTTFFAMGVLTWIAIIPLVALVMRSRPQEIGLLPDGDRSVDGVKTSGVVPEQNSTASDKTRNFNCRPTAIPIRTKELWLMGFIFFLTSFGIIAVLTHEVPFIVDIGIPLTTAATALGLTAGIGVLGKLGFGYFADRFSPKRVMLTCIALQAVGVVILMQSRSLGMVWAFVVVFALAMGGMNTLRPLIIGEFFGMDSFGRTLGQTELIRRVGAAAGPFVAGYIFDITGSYHYAFVIIIALYLTAMVMLFMIRPVR
ncbi:MFS transporter [Chloroflexota bacterium]